MRNYGPCHSLAFDIWVFNTRLYHITPQHIAKASAAGSVTGGWTFPTLASVATVFFLIALNNLAPIAINQYHMNLSTLAGKWFQDAELIKEQSNWKLHNQRNMNKLTMFRISFASPFSYEGGPTFASKTICRTELDTNWRPHYH